MRINKLAIHNFRNHKNSAMELDRLNIFVGRNNRGKSSILAAVEWALTGRNPWTDRAGRGAGDLITRDEQNCQVGLEIAGLGGVLRAMPPHSLAVGQSRNIQAGQAAIYHHLGADEQLVRLALNAWQGDFTPLITQSGCALPPKLLSKSEQLRVGIALQAAIVKMTGLNFLAVDELDMLDQDNRDLLMGSLLDMQDQFDQIMLFCTAGDVRPQSPGLPGVKLFWVEDGAVCEITRPD